ncbi:hypothetical protein LB503_003418 [Fusarium chuoi]|nr:hypothetical protein LB503_003418 [Fusarium chuoi]
MSTLGFKHATNRSDLQHNLFLLRLGDKLGLAPPNDPAAKVGRVLNVGTGTGIWAIDYTDEHPEAEACPLASNITSVSRQTFVSVLMILTKIGNMASHLTISKTE